MLRFPKYLLLYALLIAGCSTSAQAVTPFTDAVERLVPALKCIDQMPRDDRLALERCVALSNLTDADIRPNDDFLPKPTDVLLGWLGMDPDPAPALTDEVVSGALAYGQCMESAAITKVEPAVLSEHDYHQRIATFEIACLPLLPNIAPFLRGEPVAPEDAARFLLLRMIGDGAVVRVARARGWYPPSLIPCVRYGDGRPPSAACASRHQRFIRPPPPPLR